jgi:hypothetical protein
MRHSLSIGRYVEGFFGVHTGIRIGHHIAHYVATRFTRREIRSRQHSQAVGNARRGNMIKLNILPCGDVHLTGSILGGIGDAVQLPGCDASTWNLHAQHVHILLALFINAACNAEWLEFLFGNALTEITFNCIVNFYNISLNSFCDRSRFAHGTSPPSQYAFCK